MDLKAIQSALRDRQFDAWLFYDHHHRDPIAYRVLGLAETLFVTRRWFYVIPAEGEPQKLVHRIEAGHLNPLPGGKREYSSYTELNDGLAAILQPYKRVAMQYSPKNMIPYVGLVDAGTIELVRELGKEVVSSADLVARFEATWTPEQIESHKEAGRKIDGIVADAFQEIGRRVRNGGTNEYDIQRWFLEAFEREGLEADPNDAPIVGVNQNSGNPHYGPTKETAAPIKNGDIVLLDVWSKLRKPNAVFYDITWMGFCGKAPTDRMREVFQVVKGARDAGIEKVKSTIAAGKKLEGWEVDEATRGHIASKGFGQYFTHRTGHSIGVTVHGNGANMDNLETKDVRQVIPNSCFSIEPGIYMPEFGVRSEVNMLVHERSAEVTGRIQDEIVSIG
jgi:Xaa-Pro aminopeptidase